MIQLGVTIEEHNQSVVSLVTNLARRINGRWTIEDLTRL
jgi:hypothetical protein